eukprot:CAMPEP_0185558024 /NCGR_PEP_ID=MMETSP1381-20130426/51174_1 /TAXON_ID=298111 /ORGANISM="Pavlova sp., Strain CCMP459" /LENGTH=168 /DNA_ID=CAMNT_0028171535 /DNA_START=34 /DNA_END=541 /DNA_ORIENTATION=+
MRAMSSCGWVGAASISHEPAPATDRVRARRVTVTCEACPGCGLMLSSLSVSPPQLPHFAHPALATSSPHRPPQAGLPGAARTPTSRRPRTQYARCHQPKFVSRASTALGMELNLPRVRILEALEVKVDDLRLFPAAEEVPLQKMQPVVPHLVVGDYPPALPEEGGVHP